MTKEEKNKALGQYFSGHLVARILAALVPLKEGATVIDPMAGIGDMFIPLDKKGAKFSAVEIDFDAYSILKNRVASAIHGNAFSLDVLNSYSPSGYDLVITNPPYVRWQNLSNSSELPFFLPLDSILRNLSGFISTISTLNDDERYLFRNEMTKLSGLSDLAVPSWLLCMLLTARLGFLAIVVPSAWLSREYANPVIRLLRELFEVRYILTDVNSVLFKGRALVQTSLVVAQRKGDGESSNNLVSFISAYSQLLSSNSCVEQLNSYIERNESKPGLIEIKRVSQAEIWQTSGPSYATSARLSSINSILPLKDISLVGLDSFGIKSYQGLRSGANSFFYLKKNNDRFVSHYGDELDLETNSRFLLSSIQDQNDLSDTYDQTSAGNSYLLYIQNGATAIDRTIAPEYAALPEDLDSFIQTSSCRVVKGKLIPDLSAVRTNVRRRKGVELPRFWYMLPRLAARHTAYVFLPRLNSGRVHVFGNSVGRVIDANFVSILAETPLSCSTHAALALFNSTWAAIVFEEICTVMGGGALKVDAAQFNRFFFPAFSSDQLVKLDTIGKNMLNKKISDESILDDIDSVVLDGFNLPDIPAVIIELRTLLTSYISRRNGSE